MSDNILSLLKTEMDSSIDNAVQRAFEKYIHSLIRKDEDDILDISGAALLIKKAKKTVYTLVAQAKIPHAKQGHRLIFFKSELIEWLKSHRVKATQQLINETETQFLINNKKHF